MKQKRRTVMIDDKTTMKARRIGDGNLSLGLRAAVSAYSFSKSARPQHQCGGNCTKDGKGGEAQKVV